MNREEKKMQTRRRICEAAMELFELQGYEATTVQQIAERASVAKGTFFNYFQSKEDLMLDLQGRLVIQEMESMIGKPGSILPRLQIVLMEYARQFPMNRSVMRAVLQGMFGSEKLRKAHNERCHIAVKRLTPLLELAQTRGEIRPDIPAAAIAQLAMQTYIGVLTSWATEQGEEELADQMAISFDTFIQGIASKAR